MDVRTLCLGVLAFREATGYEIKKLIEDGPLSHFLDASFGSIYPALARLADEGAIAVRAEAQGNRADKKIYSLTPAGRELLRRELARHPAPDKFRSEFLFQMLLSDVMPPAETERRVAAQLERYRVKREEILAKQTPQAGAGRRFAAGFALALIDAAIAFLEAETEAARAPSPPAHRRRAV